MDIIQQVLDDVLEKAVKEVQERFNCSQSVAIAYLHKRLSEQFDACFPEKHEPQSIELCP